MKRLCTFYRSKKGCKYGAAACSNVHSHKICTKYHTSIGCHALYCPFEHVKTKPKQIAAKLYNFALDQIVCSNWHAFLIRDFVLLVCYCPQSETYDVVQLNMFCAKQVCVQTLYYMQDCVQVLVCNEQVHLVQHYEANNWRIFDLHKQELKTMQHVPEGAMYAFVAWQRLYVLTFRYLWQYNHASATWQQLKTESPWFLLCSNVNTWGNNMICMYNATIMEEQSAMEVEHIVTYDITKHEWGMIKYPIHYENTIVHVFSCIHDTLPCITIGKAKQETCMYFDGYDWNDLQLKHASRQFSLVPYGTNSVVAFSTEDPTFFTLERLRVPSFATLYNHVPKQTAPCHCDIKIIIS